MPLYVYRMHVVLTAAENKTWICGQISDTLIINRGNKRLF